HTASLGLVFADGKTLAAPFNEGLFIGQHANSHPGRRRGRAGAAEGA
ncbi:L-sorbosone dehydrogenase, partial [Pseudomonas syringae pv. pisi str. 1704B]